jgi:excisionase family DNA binding protein
VSERLLPAREVAQFLDMSTAWVLDHWQAGDLPGFKLPGGAVRFRASELEAWLEGRRRGPERCERPVEVL